MSATKPIFEIFERLDQAIDAINDMKWTGQNMNQLSIAGKDWLVTVASERNRLQGNRVEISSYFTPWNEFEVQRMKTARFNCENIGAVVLAGPLSYWAVKGIGSDGNDDGLIALGVGLADMGFSNEEIHEIQRAIRAGRILVMIPTKKVAGKQNSDSWNTRIRISNMAKYR